MTNQEIATQLSARYKVKSDTKNALAELEYQTGQRKIVLTPAEGWAGKNPEERKASAEKVLSVDVPLQKLLTEQRKLEAVLTTLEGEITGLEDNRRANEWDIRSQLVANLSSVQPANADRNTDTVQSAVDNATQAAMDMKVAPKAPTTVQFGKPASPRVFQPRLATPPAPEPFSEDDNIPF